MFVAYDPSSVSRDITPVSLCQSAHLGSGKPAHLVAWIGPCYFGGMSSELWEDNYIKG